MDVIRYDEEEQSLDMLTAGNVLTGLKLG